MAVIVRLRCDECCDAPGWPFFTGVCTGKGLFSPYPAARGSLHGIQMLGAAQIFLAVFLTLRK